jgi:hypothetical protein
MKKLRYGSRYLKVFLDSVEANFSVDIKKRIDEVVITTKDRGIVSDILDIFEEIDGPLTYQISHTGLELTFFDPRL